MAAPSTRDLRPGILPAYVTALMFRDQLFEEDESEYLPKKKAEEDEEEEEEGLEQDQEQGSILTQAFLGGHFEVEKYR